MVPAGRSGRRYAEELHEAIASGAAADWDVEGPAIETELVDGKPAEALIREARLRGAREIVVGARGVGEAARRARKRLPAAAAGGRPAGRGRPPARGRTDRAHGRLARPQGVEARRCTHAGVAPAGPSPRRVPNLFVSILSNRMLGLRARQLRQSTAHRRLAPTIQGAVKAARRPWSRRHGACGLDG